MATREHKYYGKKKELLKIRQHQKDTIESKGKSALFGKIFERGRNEILAGKRLKVSLENWKHAN